MTPIFPLSALVGVDDMVMALLLAAMDPRIGGVLLRGEKGSAKTTAARGLAALLGPDAPFVELPLGATEDRVVGALDLRAVLGRGEHAFQPGLLAAAHGGVLYVDEVNLLADHLVDVLLDVATSGVNRVERDGISHVHQSNFVLVGSMNPEEGELRPQLLDRFGLSVQVTAPIDPTVRAEAVRRRRSFDSDPDGFQAQWADAEAEMRQRLAVAIPAPLAEGIEERIAYLCVQAGAEGLRSDLVICRAAAALAGWTGADVAGEMEVSAVAQFALAHRMRTPWDTTKPDHPSLEQLVEHTKGPSNAPDGDDIPGSPRGSVPDPNAGPAQNPDPETRDTEVGDSTNRQDPAPTGDGGSPPPTLLDPVRSHGDASARAVGRRRGGASVAPRGRVIGAAQVPGSGTVSSVSAKATVTAAVTRTVESGSVVPLPLKIEGADLREAVHAQRLSNLIVLVVDASGSMGAAARVATARGAVMALLKDAYQRRDSVAMVVFRAEGAETVLRPTSSTEIGRARLDEIATGGKTPLAAGLETGLKVALTARSSGHRPLIVVVSDGRATWAANGTDPVEAALQVARSVRRESVDSVVVDCEVATRGAALGLAGSLAEVMGSRHIDAAALLGTSSPGDQLAEVIREGLSGGPKSASSS